MITVKKIAIGNEQEAFIENGLTSGCNIIFSYDNNKGKTILLQAIGYALGNEPIFPSGFEYKDLYFYIEFRGTEPLPPPDIFRVRPADGAKPGISNKAGVYTLPAVRWHICAPRHTAPASCLPYGWRYGP